MTISPASEPSESVPSSATLAPVSLPTIGDLFPSGTTVTVVPPFTYNPLLEVTAVLWSILVTFMKTSCPANSFTLNAFQFPNFPSASP